MSSRPQFSLRTLLFVMLMVCLAAATLHRAPPFEWVNGDQLWDELGLAVRVQAWLRLAACVVFPAALVAAAVAGGGYRRAFCLGSLLPAAIPLVLLSCASAEQRGELAYIGVISHMLSERIAALWVCAPCVGFVCVVVRWFVPMPRQWDAKARWKFIVRASLMAAIAAGAWWAIVALPTSATQNGLRYLVVPLAPAPSRTEPSVWRQLPLRMLLCLVLPAVLGLGAVEGRGMVRAFCGGGLLPALAPVTVVSGIDVMDAPIFGRWEPAAMYHWRDSIFAMWALVPVFGLMAACFYWLFHRGGSMGNDYEHAVEKPG
ncbi:MAG TPA: hypothetical protein VFI31_09765 [Pirellulales bacterium]|nr:hypothetical protein [Pirellulales bacterium]